MKINDSRRELVKKYVEEFQDRYFKTRTGQKHISDYERERNDIRRYWQEIKQKKANGRDYTDDVLEKLLPYANTKHNREMGYRISIMPAITKDLKIWFEASGWQKHENWPRVGEALYELFYEVIENKNYTAFADFESKTELSKGLKSGFISPTLYFLNPDFRILNNKTILTTYFIAEEQIIDRDLSNYVKYVELLKDLIASLDIDQLKDPEKFDMFCHYMCDKRLGGYAKEYYHKLHSRNKNADIGPEEDDLVGEDIHEYGSDVQNNIRYWIYAPGEGAKFWDLYYDEGTMAIGPNETGNLNRFSSRQELEVRLNQIRGVGKHSNDSLALWEFYKGIKPGDIIIAKKGTSSYLGYGIVLTDYLYDNNRKDFHHFRKVSWKSKGDWPEVSNNIVQKSLTDITRDPAKVEKLKELLNISEKISPEDYRFDPFHATGSQYWWINANPGYWNIDSYKEGEQQSYTTHNEKGNKRRIYDYFTKIMPRDLIIGYQSSPSLRVKAIFSVDSGISLDENGDEAIFFTVRNFVPYQASWEELSTIPALSNCEVFKNNQGSLFHLTKSEFDAIEAICTQGKIETLEDYSLTKALSEIFSTEKNLKSILDLLYYKKNIILQGPPGTGKTYIAKRLAFLALGKKDTSKIEMIQFHQSYSYEDFIQGFRPSDDSKFRLQNGVFYEFCLRAQRDPDHKYFFIIDEINRGNLSKIFGELMMLLEHDKRGLDFGIRLTYAGKDSDKFYIPENVYLIGTMNTADRSLAIVDYALRRRFVFVTIPPAFDHPMFEKLLKDNGVPISLIAKIKSRMEELNNVIISDDNLRKSFSVGHSYFCTKVENPNENWYRQIVENEIGPLLKEYWFDDEQKADEHINKLLRD